MAPPGDGTRDEWEDAEERRDAGDGPPATGSSGGRDAGDEETVPGTDVPTSDSGTDVPTSDSATAADADSGGHDPGPSDGGTDGGGEGGDGADGDGGPTGAVRTVVHVFREEDVPFRAASVAYYAVASFVPLLIVALSVLSLVGAQDALIDALRTGVSGSIADVIDEALQAEQGRGGAGVVGFVVAVWSATKIFRGLSVAFAKVYEREERLSLVDQIRQGVTVLAFLLLAFAVVSATNVLLALVPLDIPFAGLVWNLVALLGLAVGMLPLFYVLPPLSVSVRHALPGAVVAAVGWVVLQYGFSIYAQNAGSYAAYGFLGAVLLFVIFLYFAAIVILLGAVVNVSLDEDLAPPPTD